MSEPGAPSCYVPVPFTGLPAGVGDAQTRELWEEVQRLTAHNKLLKDEFLVMATEIEALRRENAALRIDASEWAEACGETIKGARETADQRAIAEAETHSLRVECRLYRETTRELLDRCAVREAEIAYLKHVIKRLGGKV